MRPSCSVTGKLKTTPSSHPQLIKLTFKILNLSFGGIKMVVKKKKKAEHFPSRFEAFELLFLKTLKYQDIDSRSGRGI